MSKEKIILLSTVADNLTRYWKALRREFGDNELLRADFMETINYELINNKLSDKIKVEELSVLIFNC